MGFLIFFAGLGAGVLMVFMWTVPAEDFTKPTCPLCNGNGHAAERDRWRLR